MSTETRTIPKVAKSAFGLLLQEHQRALNVLAHETAEAMGLNPKDNLKFNFAAGTVDITTPDAESTTNAEG